MTDMKTCSKCGESKPLTEYYVSKGYRKAACKECVRTTIRRHRVEAGDAVRARERDYYRKNREDRLAAQSEYYQANREDVLQYNKAFRAENPHLGWEAHYLSRVRRLSLPQVLESFTKPDVIERYGDSCFYCGGDFEHLDHYVPVSKGGPHTLDNVRPSCTSCNARKWSFDPSEWVAS